MDAIQKRDDQEFRLAWLTQFLLLNHVTSSTNNKNIENKVASTEHAIGDQMTSKSSNSNTMYASAVLGTRISENCGSHAIL